MVRSMYSGVAGMRTHQTSLDVIGNNIANVNTHGFKSSRTTFRDIYYQSMRGASAASATRGGVNPSQVGVGTQVGSIDVMQTRSSFTQTDMTMDVAIDGEGFLQIMDANGNKFYTRAGQLNFDAFGNLVDSKGNFVLGVNGNPLGKAASSEKIQVQLGSVEPQAGSVTQIINSKSFTITASKETRDSNVNIQFLASNEITEDVEAEVSNSGIVVKIRSSAVFATLEAFNTAMNSAIHDASVALWPDGHPGGTFTITSESLTNVWPDADGNGMTGAQIASGQYGRVAGTLKPASLEGGISIENVGTDFSAVSDAANPDLTLTITGGTTDEHTVTIVVGGVTYTGTIAADAPAGTVKLTNGTEAKDTIIIRHPAASTLDAATFGTAGTATITEVTATKAYTPNNLGFSTTSFLLQGGTEGGPQGIESLSGISIGTDGSIIGFHSMLGDESGRVFLGRIDLATFKNPQGLTEAGSVYFTTSANSGSPTVVKAGEDGSGQIVSGSLELSNVDLAKEFTEMIKTQRGYQANSRVITVTDTMLEELINLKR